MIRAIARCVWCGHLVWPWQRQGFTTTTMGADRFHSRCWPFVR